MREVGITAMLAVLSSTEPYLKTFLGWYQISIESTGYHILLEENNVSSLDPAKVVLVIAGLNLITVSSFP